MRLTRKLAFGLGTIAILLVLNQIFEYGVGDFFVNPYYARIVNLIGINITLAVSLNLINGLAGQFSIGHAGFMAVGGLHGDVRDGLPRPGDGGARRQHARRSARVVGRHGGEPRRRRAGRGHRRVSQSACRRCV